MRPLLLLLCALLLGLTPSCDSRKSKKAAAQAARKHSGGGGGRTVLAPWTERPLGAPALAAAAEVVGAWAARSGAASGATPAELEVLRVALTAGRWSPERDASWRSGAEAWMARARQTAKAEVEGVAMAAAFLVDGLAMGARDPAALGDSVALYGVVISSGQEGQALPVYEIALTRYAALLSQQIRVKLAIGGRGAASEVAALRTQADTVYRTIINSRRLAPEQHAQVIADFGFFNLEWTLANGGGPPSQAIGGGSADGTPSIHRAASLFLQARPQLRGTQAGKLVDFGLAVLNSLTGHWSSGADSLAAAMIPAAAEATDGLDCLTTDPQVCTLAAQLSAGLASISDGGSAALDAAAAKVGCTLLDDAAAPTLLHGWIHQDLADPLLDAFSAPEDPINPLDAPLRQMDLPTVRRLLSSDMALARLPGPTGVTALTLVFWTIVQTQLPAQGMYWVCQWDFKKHSAMIQVLLDANADVWAADNFGLTPAYLAVGGSGCLECLAIFHKGGMRLDDQNLERLYPGASAETIFRLLLQMETRQMVLASAVLRHDDRQSMQSALPGCTKLSKALRSSVLSSDTVTVDDLHKIETGYRSSWFKLLLRMDLNPNLRSIETGETFLHCAARKGWDDIVALLLDAGADAQAVTLPASAASGSKTTALHLAASNGYTSVVELLLGNSAGAADAIDARGRKPKDVVPDQMKELRQLLGTTEHAAPRSCTDEPLSVDTTITWNEWDLERASELMGTRQAKDEGRCDIDIVSAGNMTLTNFIANYYGSKPILIRNAGAYPRTFFNPTEFASHFGTERLQASVLPYGQTYGVPSKHVSMTSFIVPMTQEESRPTAGSTPEYILPGMLLLKTNHNFYP